ncbi:MAG: transposase [Gemmatimonadetes bacterium]|nr:transposase [Gemmatimonadota bacterium]
MVAEVGHFARWYNEHRPHETLRGATPAEVRDAVRPAKDVVRLETRPGVPLPRGRPPRDGPRRARSGALEAVVERLEGRRHLPIVSLRRAA